LGMVGILELQLEGLHAACSFIVPRM